MNKSKYLEEIKSIDDVKNALKTFIPQTLIFLDEDDINLDLQVRFQHFLDSSINPFSDIEISEAQLFMALIMSYFTQALIIITMTMALKVVPFIRHGLPFYYYKMVVENFLDTSIAKKINYLSSYAYLLNENYSYNKIEDIQFCDYYAYAREFNFENKLFERLSIKEERLSKTPLPILKKTINEIQESFFNGLVSKLKY